MDSGFRSRGFRITPGFQTKITWIPDYLTWGELLHLQRTVLSLVFICRENPRRSGISLFPDRPRFSRLMKTENRRYARSSGMNGDKSRESGAFLFSRRVPDFCDGRRSFPTNGNSNFDRRGRRRPSAMDSAHYQTPKLLGLIPPITNKHGISQINRVMAISNLLPKRQTFMDIIKEFPVL